MNFLTYQDINGRRKPRRYIVAAGLILLALAVLAWIGSEPTQSESLTDISYLSPTNTPQINQNVESLTPTTVPMTNQQPCPVNVDEWKMVEIFPGDYYLGISQTCVYEGVAQTAAWLLAERIGYSKLEAAEILGFEELPWSPENEVRAYTNNDGPTLRKLNGGWPAHPDFYFWQVNKEGQPAIVISLRGCYILDGTAYCVLAMDRSPGSAVNVLGVHKFASHAGHKPAMRSFYLLKYKGESVWNLVGQFADTVYEISDSDQIILDREHITIRLGVEPWDADWLHITHGLAMKPLPVDWRLIGMDEAAVKGISDAFNQIISDPSGGDDV
jgi:hypothetical protein